MIARNPLFLRDEELDKSLELLLLAERDVMSQVHEALSRLGLSESDFRVLYLVDRHPGTTTAELCIVLGMTKQSLSRHIRYLCQTGFLRPQASRNDRRKRPLFATETAGNAITAVGALYKRGLRKAFKAAGSEAVEGFQRVLGELVTGPGRHMVAREP